MATVFLLSLAAPEKERVFSLLSHQIERSNDLEKPALLEQENDRRTLWTRTMLYNRRESPADHGPRNAGKVLPVLAPSSYWLLRLWEALTFL